MGDRSLPFMMYFFFYRFLCTHIILLMYTLKDFIMISRNFGDLLTKLHNNPLWLFDHMSVRRNTERLFFNRMLSGPTVVTQNLVMVAVMNMLDRSVEVRYTYSEDDEELILYSKLDDRGIVSRPVLKNSVTLLEHHWSVLFSEDIDEIVGTLESIWPDANEAF